MIETATRYDAIPLRATTTPEGYLRDSPVIARSGIQIYNKGGRRVREYRPHDIIFAPQALAAVQGIPVVDLHPGEVNAANVRKHAIGTVLSAGREDADGRMVADIVVYDTEPVTKHGRKELSLAYKVRVDETPGVSPEGEAYDQRVTEIVAYNHLGIVPRGRAGVARLRLDEHDAVSTDLASEEGPLAADPKLVSIRLDSGLSYEAVPEVAAAFQQHRDAFAAAQARHDAALKSANDRADAAAASAAEAVTRAAALEAERDTLKGDVAKFDAAIAQARADGAADARARSALEAEAREFGVEAKADMDDRAVREAVVTKLAPDTYRFDGQEDVYVRVAFDSATAAARKAKANGAAAVATVTTALATRADGKGTAHVRSSKELFQRFGAAR